MALTSLKCPDCGGTVHLEEDMKKCFCTHCGIRIVNGAALSVTDILRLAKDALAAHDWNAAREHVDGIMKKDTKCRDAWYMSALLSYRDKNAFGNALNKIAAEEMKDHGIFSEDDIKKCWGRFEIRIKNGNVDGAYGRLETMTLVTVDGREMMPVRSNVSEVFGVDPGEHEISVCLGFSNERYSELTGHAPGIRELPGSEKNTLCFTVTGDHEFELKLIKKGGMFSLPKFRYVITKLS